MHKMQVLDFPHRFQRYVRMFLSNRRGQVEINVTRSKTIKLCQGLPKGSAISPVLFIIFINDIDTMIPSHGTGVPGYQTQVSRRRMLEKEVPQRLKTIPGWRTTTGKRTKNIHINRDIVSLPLPPWNTLPNLNLDTVQLVKKKAEFTVE